MSRLQSKIARPPQQPHLPRRGTLPKARPDFDFGESAEESFECLGFSGHKRRRPISVLSFQESSEGPIIRTAPNVLPLPLCLLEIDHVSVTKVTVGVTLEVDCHANRFICGLFSPSSAGSANLRSSGYFRISVGGAGTRLPLIIDFNSIAFTPALLSK